MRLSATRKSDARSKINGKLKAPIPKIPVIIKRKTKGLLPLITLLIFESIVIRAAVGEEKDLLLPPLLQKISGSELLWHQVSRRVEKFLLCQLPAKVQK